MRTFKVELTFSGDHNVDPEKKHGETVNFVAGGDTTADFFIHRFTIGLQTVLAEYPHTRLVSATIQHSSTVKDDLLTGVRTVISPKKPTNTEIPVDPSLN